ncbi:MAG TPA: AMP-binding protein, partial [Stellaceae bacterium]|nr:AMP-binding protein [Stellaceae bacterium]
MSGALTLPQLLRRHAERTPDRPAMREKDLGIWQPHSWQRYWQEVRDFALGLAARGFARGDKLSVIGENRPRLYVAQLAAMSLGGIAVPVYQDAIASELAYVLDHAETSVVVAEDQEQVDKILSLEARLPHLGLVVYDDPRGMRHYASPVL